ncbi:MAG TPA: hypothetical protein VGT78_04145 [Rhizomicrobium sp.]|nr:hypothetical protein [Rhizomicrobium sp.]
MPHRQLILVIMGAIIWFIAAMLIRFTLPLGWLAGGAITLVLFAITIPFGAIMIEGAHRLVKGDPRSIMNTAVIICLVGLMLDGIAFVWASPLYTGDRAVLWQGGAWLLWTVGAILAYATLRDARTAAA